MARWNLRREEKVITNTQAAAMKYDLNPIAGGRVFGWLIKETVNVEVAYLKSLGKREETGERLNRKSASIA